MLRVTPAKKTDPEPTVAEFRERFTPMPCNQFYHTAKEGNLTLRIGKVDENSAMIEVPFELYFQSHDVSFLIKGNNSHVSLIYVQFDHYYGYFSFDDGFCLLENPPEEPSIDRFDGTKAFSGLMCDAFDWPDEKDCHEHLMMFLIGKIATGSQFLINRFEPYETNLSSLADDVQRLENVLTKLFSKAMPLPESKVAAPVVPVEVSQVDPVALQRKIDEVRAVAAEFQRVTAELNAMLAALPKNGPRN